MGVKGSQPRNAGPQNTNNVSLCSPLDSQRVDGSAGDLEEERPISWYGCFRSFFSFFLSFFQIIHARMGGATKANHRRDRRDVARFN